jgi:hypothetical protein
MAGVYFAAGAGAALGAGEGEAAGAGVALPAVAGAGLDKVVGFPLVFLGGVGLVAGGRLALLILWGGAPALGKRASRSDQEGQAGRGKAPQNRNSWITHPSTHTFPD